MATMYPRTLAEDEITKSEVKVYEAVRDGLPDEWEAFHSVGWVARDHAEGSEGWGDRHGSRPPRARRRSA